MSLKSLKKIFALAYFGGATYVTIELFGRGFSHWSMFFLGALCFISYGLINEVIPWGMPLWLQMLIGAVITTLLEFIVGYIVNIKLGWAVWDYSNVPGNICGQICPQFSFLWFWLSGVGIVLDDYLRYWWYGEDKPHYTIWRWGNGS